MRKATGGRGTVGAAVETQEQGQGKGRATPSRPIVRLGC